MLIENQKQERFASLFFHLFCIWKTNGLVRLTRAKAIQETMHRVYPLQVNTDRRIKTVVLFDESEDQVEINELKERHASEIKTLQERIGHLITSCRFVIFLSN